MEYEYTIMLTNCIYSLHDTNRNLIKHTEGFRNIWK